MKSGKAKTTKIPEFSSYEEEAKFWDTHDTTEFSDEFKQVKLSIGKKLLNILSIRFDSSDLMKLEKEAQKKGIGPTTLVRMWVKEKLA